MFASLKVRNYRLFFVGQVVSNIGTWMQRIAQDWLVLSLTGSSAAVGITTALQFLPMLLFGLYGGALADHVDRRKLLIGCGVAQAVFTGEVTTGNNTDQQRADSSVLYGTRSGARTQAREVAQRLDISDVRRLDADTRDLGENADVVVILGQDKAP